MARAVTEALIIERDRPREGDTMNTAPPLHFAEGEPLRINDAAGWVTASHGDGMIPIHLPTCGGEIVEIDRNERVNGFSRYDDDAGPLITCHLGENDSGWDHHEYRCQSCWQVLDLGTFGSEVTDYA
jgi:hypothetical protein